MLVAPTAASAFAPSVLLTVTGIRLQSRRVQFSKATHSIVESGRKGYSFRGKIELAITNKRGINYGRRET